MAHLVDAQPGFLQQIVGVPAAYELDQEIAMQLWAEAIDERGGRVAIALLITSHQ